MAYTRSATWLVYKQLGPTVLFGYGVFVYVAVMATQLAGMAREGFVLR